MNVRDEVKALYNKYVDHGTPEYITAYHGSAYSIRAICEAFMLEYPGLVCSTTYGDTLSIYPTPGEKASGVRISDGKPDTDYTNFRLTQAENGLAKVLKNLELAVTATNNGNVSKSALRKRINKIIHDLSGYVQSLEDSE